MNNSEDLNTTVKSFTLKFNAFTIVAVDFVYHK